MALSLSFNTSVEAEIYGINEYLGVPKDYDIETDNPTVYIDYELQPEARSWGIKSISIVPTKIRCIIEWDVDCLGMSESEIAMLLKSGGKEYKANYSHTVSGIIEIETSCLDDDWKIDNSVEFRPDGAVSIDSVEIDLSERTITLS